MADDAAHSATTNGVESRPLPERTLLSSSTKKRISSLQEIRVSVESKEVDSSRIDSQLASLFETYPLYVDRPSRHAVQRVLQVVGSNQDTAPNLGGLVDLISNESQHVGIAPGNALVLTEWISVLLVACAKSKVLWTKFGLDLVQANARTIATCVSSSAKPSIKRSVYTVTRRSFRHLLSSSELGDDTLTIIVSALTKKQFSNTSANSVLLGLIAGVVSRQPLVKPHFENVKNDYYAFYLRELIGSRTPLPNYIPTGLHELFENFTTLSDLSKDLLPTIEKALLRSPEVVLDDILAISLSALDPKLDLSEILEKHLLKPLLSCSKSTNVSVRAGAQRTLVAIAKRCRTESSVDRVADEVLQPLKQGKLTNAEHKTIHANMLLALSTSGAMSQKIIAGLGAVTAKETNDTALEAEVRALLKNIAVSVQRETALENSTIDVVCKGLADKKITVRRTWAIEFGEMVWKLSTTEIKSEICTALLLKTVPKLSESVAEVHANPLPAVQSGLLAVASVATALCLHIFRGLVDSKVADLASKSVNIASLLIAEPKPSFVLNPKVFTKVQISEDVLWMTRSLFGLAQDISKRGTSFEAQQAWAQSVIYFTCASTISPQLRKTATQSLSDAYMASPKGLGPILVEGVWSWRLHCHNDAKESAAVLSKSSILRLHLVLKTICPSPAERENAETKFDDTVLEKQLIHMSVLCQRDLIPQISWIDLCLRTGIDPGKLVQDNLETFLQEIRNATETYDEEDLLLVHEAAYRAAAELAFVAPEHMIPLLVTQLSSDLESSQLIGVGLEEAAIYRTPEGTAYIDVLASRSQQVVSKNVKDYDTLKWEEELRAELDKKTGKGRKLTPNEQAKVMAQLRKESAIRKSIATTNTKLRRGIGIIKALATGPPTEEERWIVQAVDMLITAIEAGAGLIVGDAASRAYIDCSSSVTLRVGTLRPFIGVATLRAIGVSQIPERFMAEALEEQITRVLYRMKFLGEQRPFDAVSIAYMLPLILLVLQSGGFAPANSEEADEQLLLALEFISAHTDSFSNETLPRTKLLTTLIAAMRKYPQHHRLARDCLQDLSRSIEPTITRQELEILLKGTIVPQSTVRNAVLQTIDAELDLSDLDFSEEIWLACHDDEVENSEIARTIWAESGFSDSPDSIPQTMVSLDSADRALRRAAAKSLVETISNFPDQFENTFNTLTASYVEKAAPKAQQRDKYGMLIKMDLSDDWQARSGVALALKELALVFPPDLLVDAARFLIERGPFGDQNPVVRDEMIEAATAFISIKGGSKVEELMNIFETALENPDRSSASFDNVNEAVVILYGALARHLKKGDKRVPSVVQRLLATLSTPSESVQFAVAKCLPPLVQASADQVSTYIDGLMEELLQGKMYASRRGSAYGLAGVVHGKGVGAFREFRVMSTLKGATENKKDSNARQGAYLAYELFSLVLERNFEPYVMQIVPQLLAGFGDVNGDVREACLDASKTAFAKLSSFGVKQVLPVLLEGLEEQQWRSKKGACDSLGAMAYLDPLQLAASLPEIIPPLTNVLNDSHKEVRASAKRSLQRFGEVISNPEIRKVVDILLKALSDPTKYTDEALDSLIKIQFAHFLDAPSLALVVRILERGLGDRSVTKRKASQIIGSLAHLTERKDLLVHLPILVAGLKVAIVDPVPATRATASKALGSTVEKLGEDALPELIPSLMMTLKADTGAGERLGSAQALSEVLAGLGTTRLEETLPTILQNVTSSKPSVREGFMSLFIFLPACFGNSFANYLNRIIPPILAGLADDVESIRETALRAGRLLVKNFATRAIDLLLPELERGLADDSHRIRLSSVELVGDLLFNLTGITAKAEQEEEEEATAINAGQSLLEVLGEEKRNKVLSAIYICRCDTSGQVRTAAIAVWKALVATPKTTREILPTLTQLLVRRLASPNMEQKVIAGNALGELIRKSGEGVLTTLLPTLEDGLHTTDTDAKQGICIALKELISSANPEALEDHEQTLISVVRTALVDADEEVRDAAAEAFDSLQRIIGKRAVDHVLPHLLSLLSNEGDAENALAALLTLLTDTTRSNIILPNLLPTLLKSPISAFNAGALASLAEVASGAMTRRLPTILNALVDNIVVAQGSDRQQDLSNALDGVLLSIDEFDGLNTTMAVMLQLVKNDDHHKRRVADQHLAHFFARAEINISRYYPDLIRVFLIAFDDSDKEVVKVAWEALNELTKRMKKEEMESLVISTRQILQQVGVAGSDLPGFCLPKGITAILPIFLQGLMNGSPEQRTQAALAISDIVDRTSAESLRPFVTQITGPLIRIVSERQVEVKSAILFTLNNLLEKIPTYLKPFIPQLQRTFAKSLADTTSETLRTRAAKALGTLITLTPRVDPLIAELVTGSKTPDSGVRNAMLKALYEIVTKAGANMSDASKNSILSLVDSTAEEKDDTTSIALAKLLGGLVNVLPDDAAAAIIRSRVVTNDITYSSMLALNAVLLESAESLLSHFDEETRTCICKGINYTESTIADNSILAAGKYMLSQSSNKSFEASKSIFEAFASVIPPGNSSDNRRLALVAIRTISREHNDLVRPHLALLAPPIFASVRDMVIPVKLAAEAAFLSIFSVVEDESSIFDKYITGPGMSLPPTAKRSMQDYFKRVVVRLAAQARERKEAEGGAGALGLLSDEAEDEREIWSVGRIDLGDGAFNEE